MAQYHIIHIWDHVQCGVELDLVFKLGCFFFLLEITKFEDYFPNLKNQTRNDKGGCGDPKKEKKRVELEPKVQHNGLPR